MNEGKKTCADCVNSFEYFSEVEGKTVRACETVGWGMPCNVSPPYDNPCKFFSETERHDDTIFEKIFTAIQEEDWDDDD